MIWLRRTIALPLALIFIILFVFLLLAFRINSTVGNPDFCIGQLRKADVYNFVYEEVLPAALEEADIGEDNAEAGIDISRLKPHVIDLTRQILPPEWLQRQMENTISAILPYAFGNTESFTVSIPLKDRIEATGQAAKATLHKEGVFAGIYDPAMDLVLDEAESNLAQIPPPFTLTRGELETIIRRLLPEEWLLTQVDGAIDEVVPYLTGDKEHFAVKVDIEGRLDVLEAIVTDILKRPQTYDYFLTGVIAPTIKQNIGSDLQLPMGIELTDDEIFSSLKEVLPPETYQALADDIVRQIFSYLRGTQETMEVVIPLANRKPVIASTLGSLIDRKLENLIDSLPYCTAAELIAMLLNPPLDRLPECHPLDISYQELKGLLGIEISSIIAPLLDTWIPDQFVLSDAELRQLLAGGEDKDLLAQGRELVQQGFSYTDADLRADLAEDYEGLENIRQRIAAGFTFSDEELRELALSDGDDGEETWQSFQEIRSQIGTARRWMMAVWLIPLLLLLGIGALGGRNWRSRLIWATSVPALASAVAYIAFGPLFSALARPEINKALMPGTAQTEGLQGIMTSKSIEIAQNAIDSFVSGISTQAIILLVVALVIIVIAILWYTIIRKQPEDNNGGA